MKSLNELTNEMFSSITETMQAMHETAKLQQEEILRLERICEDLMQRLERLEWKVSRDF